MLYAKNVLGPRLLLKAKGLRLGLTKRCEPKYMLIDDFPRKCRLLYRRYDLLLQLGAELHLAGLSEEWDGAALIVEEPVYMGGTP